MHAGVHGILRVLPGKRRMRAMSFGLSRFRWFTGMRAMCRVSAKSVKRPFSGKVFYGAGETSVIQCNGLSATADGPVSNSRAGR